LSIGLLIQDTLFVQVAVSIIGESETLQIVVSYIPPNGSYKLYKTHLENITDIYNNLQNHQHICVIGDFNLSFLVWSQDPEHHSSLPSNIHQQHEILFIEDVFSMGLIQVNNIFNNLHKILDLVFVSADINYSLVQCNSPISNCDIHHRSLLLGINFYSFAPSAEYSPRFIFNETSPCAIRNEIPAINWESVLSHVSLESCYDTFLVVILNIIVAGG